MRLRLRTIAATLTLTALTSSAFLVGTAQAEEAPRRMCFIFCRAVTPVPPAPAPAPVVPAPAPAPAAPPALPVVPKPPTVAPPSTQLSVAGLLRLMNSHRATHGARALRIDAGLTSVALAHTKRMAAANRLYHNDSLFSRATHRALGIASFGENVVVESSVLAGHQAFLASPHHHENLDRREWVLVGIAIVRDSRGQYWMTHNFGTARSGAAAVAAAVPHYRPSAGNELPALPRRNVARPAARPTRALAVPAVRTAPRPTAPTALVAIAKPRPTSAIATPRELSQDRQLALDPTSLHNAIDPATRNTGTAAAGLFAGVLFALIVRQSYVTAAARGNRKSQPTVK